MGAFEDIFLEIPVWLIVPGGFLTAFLITFVVIPSIVKVSEQKGLYDKPNHRTSHVGNIPTLGGAAVFIGLILTISIFSGPGIDHELKYIIGALLILFFIGIKDDVLIIDSKKKLAAQIIAAAILPLLADIRITSFYNLMGINEIPYFLSIVFTVFVIVVIINGFNLIDGIDGLASGVGILVSAVFAIWFFLSGYVSYGMMALALTGSLTAFFYFNVFGKKNKIFLGDTGSLIIGMIIAVFVIRFLEYNLVSGDNLKIYSSPIVAFGILIVPLFDTLRVFIIRVIQKKSPFHADKQHVHHRLLELGNSHIESSLIIIGVNLFFILLCFILQDIGCFRLFLLIMLLATVLSYIPVWLVNKRFSAEKSAKASGK